MSIKLNEKFHFNHLLCVLQNNNNNIFVVMKGFVVWFLLCARLPSGNNNLNCDGD